MKWIDASEAKFWDLVFGREPPRTKHAVSQKTASNEDVVFVEKEISGEFPWSLYCICDGHAGIEAAAYIKKHLWNTLKPLLPVSEPNRICGLTSWAAEIRDAIATTFAKLEDGFSDRYFDRCNAGSTLTIALSCGWFLTVANLGDTEAVLDTGSKIELMTHSHRLEECEKERKRLIQAGVKLARLGSDLSGPADQGDVGRGPQRCWPGGLANSRSIGDLDAGRHVVPSPHIKQCVLPHLGCRLIIGSDGLWDVLNHRAACQVTRTNCNKSSAERLVTLAVYRNNWAVYDDTTALVIDFLPEDAHEFPQICIKIKKSQNKIRPCITCLCAAHLQEDDVDSFSASSLICIAEVDSASKEPETILSSLDKCNSYSVAESSSASMEF